MIVCKLSSRIFIIMKYSIVVYHYASENKDEKLNKFRKGK
jgi:hypothetical protein